MEFFTFVVFVIILVTLFRIGYGLVKFGEGGHEIYLNRAELFVLTFVRIIFALIMIAMFFEIKP